MGQALRSMRDRAAARTTRRDPGERYDCGSLRRSRYSVPARADSSKPLAIQAVPFARRSIV